MLSIGEFSSICRVSTKTLRYYDEIGLLTPSEINPQNGYRYYAIEQMETLLFINRLKTYSFSLDEIKKLMQEDVPQERLKIRPQGIVFFDGCVGVTSVGIAVGHGTAVVR